MLLGVRTPCVRLHGVPFQSFQVINKKQSTPFFDLSRFGIDFVASPRHADGIHVTGPITRNMQTALLTFFQEKPGTKNVSLGYRNLSGGK
jgi:Ni,Fe-hydrogenase III small subunit